MGTLGEPAAAADGVETPPQKRRVEQPGGAGAPRSAARLPLGLLALLAALGAWGGWLIARTSLVVDGRRVFCLFDDAMISMTYARNLLDGYGLNWARQGSPVEGFTHPLWLLLMLPANVPGMPLAWRSLPVQVMSLLFLGAAAAVAWLLVRRHFAPAEAPFALPAAALTASYYPLAYWTVMGMEVALQALLALLCVHLALDSVFGGRQRHGLLWALCAAAFLLRMDMLLLVVVVQAYVLIGGGVRGAGRRAWWIGAACFVGAALGYELFRWVYFHDLLPNTYYLKLTGLPLAVRLRRGMATFGDFAARHALLLLAAAAIAVWRRRDRRLWLPLAVFGAFAAYEVWVGGDAWEDIGLRADRFVAFVMPMLFVVLNAGLDAALAAWARRRRATAGDESPPLPGARTRFGLGAAAAAVTCALWLLANGLASPESARWNWRLLTGIEPPPLVNSHRDVLTQLSRFERIVRPQATVATAWAGIPAFFSDYRMVDLLGYNDRYLARRPGPRRLVPERYWELIPGHTKWDVDYELERVRPDAFFQIWGVRTLGPVNEVMHQHGYRQVGHFWLRADSPWAQAQRHHRLASR
ncbi:MAG TPA: hypothetical protein VGS57_00665 [Thermoanaerobaculia bacterium]|jgi:hypothetical protein|nr:hypothetical protein [Thermoanaerobaculia bacterium]